MEEDVFFRKIRVLIQALKGLFLLLVGLLFITVLLRVQPQIFVSTSEDLLAETASRETNALPVTSSIISEEDIQDGIHVPTGMKVGNGIEQTIITCTACHSAKLITQNRATREGWISMIRWMQATQNLQDLGEKEDEIVTYLATFYAPEKVGRRKNLEVSEWYRLN